MLNKYFLSACILLVTVNLILAKSNYGKFRIKLLSFEIISYPKQKEYITVDYVMDEYENGTLALRIYSNVKQFMGVLGLKFRCSTWNEAQQKFNLAYNIAMKNICEKPYAKVILATVPMLNKDCNINPGPYNFTIDYDRFLQSLSNGNFFYGKYWSTTDVFTSEHGRFIKVNVTVLVTPV